MGRTEKIKDNSDPDFSTSVTIPYFFEELQTIKFDVFVVVVVVFVVFVWDFIVG